ncbi:MAG: T9SS type B sorting domain-containing protein [Aquaticitalea sp.]
MITIQNIRIIDYSNFVTPNDDNVHDTRNIVAFRDQPIAKFNIYDRYSKLLVNIKFSGSGWDCTFKGYQLPFTDYWFLLTYEESVVPKEFSAHFTLK